MKNVAILTYTNTTNYGAILQAYALKSYIKSMGNSCDIINYHCKAVDKREKIFFNHEKNTLKNILKKLILFPIKLNRKIKIFSFCKKNSIYTKRKYYAYNINELNRLYDVFIVGSDQVWNLNLNGKDDVYVLNFADREKKLIAYAASIGNNSIFEENLEYFLENLKKFNMISVREESSNALLKRNNINSCFVLDPIFLLSKENWLKCVKCKKKKKPKYILLYFIHNGNETFDIAKKIAKKYNYKIIYLNNYGVPVKGMKNIFSVTPFEFLEYINNAELIITGSFHGIAFSINFNKQFLYEISNNSRNCNDRIYNMIRLFELKNSIKNIDICTTINNIVDYRFINKILDNKKIESKNFLKKWIEE